MNTHIQMCLKFKEIFMYTKRGYMILMITAMAKMFLLSTGLLHHTCHLLLTTMKKEHTFLIMQRPLNTCKLLPERKSFHFLVLGRKIWKILKIFWLKVSLIEQRLMMQLRESRRYMHVVGKRLHHNSGMSGGDTFLFTLTQAFQF